MPKSYDWAEPLLLALLSVGLVYIIWRCLGG
jgi:hypothetical protein